MDINGFLKKTREDLHRIPEKALREFKTAEYIRGFLDRNRIEYTAVGTSTVALFRGGPRWLAFRADIDGLPVAEETGRAFASEHRGMMHACGHDGHTANLLLLARRLRERTAAGRRLKRSVMLIFQAAEEGEGGARAVARHRVFSSKKLDGVFALHLAPGMEEGAAGSAAGPVSYQNCDLDIEITGRGCHGAQAFRGIDVILVGAKLVEAYQSIVSRNLKPEDVAVLSIGSFHAGGARNIIPETAKLAGTIRVTDKELLKLIRARLEAINRGFETAYGVRIKMRFRPFYPAIVNSAELYGVFLRSARKAGAKIYENARLSGSEDFSFYLQKGAKGLYFLLGSKNARKGLVHPLHSPRFDFDPAALETGNGIFWEILREMGAF